MGKLRQNILRIKEQFEIYRKNSGFKGDQFLIMGKMNKIIRTFFRVPNRFNNFWNNHCRWEDNFFRTNRFPTQYFREFEHDPFFNPSFSQPKEQIHQTIQYDNNNQKVKSTRKVDKGDGKIQVTEEVKNGDKFDVKTYTIDKYEKPKVSYYQSETKEVTIKDGQRIVKTIKKVGKPDGSIDVIEKIQSSERVETRQYTIHPENKDKVEKKSQ